MTDDWKSVSSRSDESDENSGIGELLEEGYDLLDGFTDWLERVVRLDSRTTEQDCFNAEFLIDYLANYHQKSVYQLNEYELRWFLFSHYIRKAGAEAETEERLCETLQRLYGYLSSEHAYFVPDWISGALDERAYFIKRRNDYHALGVEDEQTWQQGFRNWCAELEDDLDARCLWLPRELSGGVLWNDMRGWREATLYEEANTLWQENRLELLEEGLDFDRIHEELMIAYLTWVETPQDRLEGLTPVEVIEQERIERGDEDEQDESQE